MFQIFLKSANGNTVLKIENKGLKPVIPQWCYDLGYTEITQDEFTALGEVLKKRARVTVGNSNDENEARRCLIAMAEQHAREAG